MRLDGLTPFLMGLRFCLPICTSPCTCTPLLCLLYDNLSIRAQGASAGTVECCAFIGAFFRIVGSTTATVYFSVFSWRLFSWVACFALLCMAGGTLEPLIQKASSSSPDDPSGAAISSLLPSSSSLSSSPLAPAFSQNAPSRRKAAMPGSSSSSSSSCSSSPSSSSSRSSSPSSCSSVPGSLRFFCAPGRAIVILTPDSICSFSSLWYFLPLTWPSTVFGCLLRGCFVMLQ
mmetsp:Transcript_31275/g.81711  ORF Transcript_31275/g.81711 Transcript_31275/m.81711 type:complete len:231 (-) Transcript_31275:253-945(-)